MLASRSSRMSNPMRLYKRASKRTVAMNVVGFVLAIWLIGANFPNELDHAHVDRFAVVSGVFQGKYSDPNHPCCPRTIEEAKRSKYRRNIPIKLKVYGKDVEGGSTWMVPGLGYSDRSIVVDFSSKGGPKDLHGKLDYHSNIVWSDGNVWKRTKLRRELKRGFMEGWEYLWEMPDCAQGDIKAVLFFAHGCTHQATDSWPWSSICPDCLDLPVERQIREKALARNFIFLAISSAGAAYCWEVHRELGVVTRIIEAVAPAPDTPIVAIGTSMGGDMVSSLPQTLGSRLKAIVCEISFSSGDVNSREHPPTFYIHMPKDGHTARMIGLQAFKLRENGVDVQVREARPIPINATYFSDYGQVSKGTSQRWYDLLSGQGFLDENGFLTVNSRSFNKETWAKIMQIWDKREKQWFLELLQLAEGIHETTFQYIDQALDWLLSKLHS